MRLIDADALIANTEVFCDMYEVNWTIGKVRAWIGNAPTIESEPVKHGKWVAVECGTFCTNCRRVFDDNFQIPHHVCKELIRCPDCGAIMDGGNAE